MNIQSNINQMISLTSLLASKSSRAESIKDAKALQGRQKQAVRGLKDIKKNLEREELTSEIIDSGSKIGPPTEKEFNKLEANLEKVKELGGPKLYTKEEFENIKERTKQYQKDIYDAKSGALNPQFKGLINPDLIDQPELSSMLGNISNKTSSGLSRLNQVQQAKAAANEAQQAKLAEQAKSEEFRKTIMEGVTPEYGVRERF